MAQDGMARHGMAELSPQAPCLAGCFGVHPWWASAMGSSITILFGAVGVSGARMLSGSACLCHAVITRMARGESPSRSPAGAQGGSESPGPAPAAVGPGTSPAVVTATGAEVWPVPCGTRACFPKAWLLTRFPQRP